MKTTIALLICLSFGIFSETLYAGTNDLIFSDDFSNPAAWESQGNGAVYVQDGECHFDNVFCGAYNRVYRCLNYTLPTTYWRAESEFTISNPNPAGYGTGEVVTAITAGQLDFMSYDASMSYEETYQDGIAVILLSDFSNDNDINDWYFFIEAKHGTTRNFDLGSRIYASSAVSKYYIRLERLSEELTRLSIFTDAEYSNELPGSPVSFAINPLISRLSFIQHGTITPGFYTRLINGRIDNDAIYDSPAMNTVTPELAFAGKGNLFLYPNPARESIHVISPEGSSQIREFRIFNLLGQEVNRTAGDATNQLDISGLAEGVFLLLVTGAEKTFWGRFEKQ